MAITLHHSPSQAVSLTALISVPSIISAILYNYNRIKRLPFCPRFPIKAEMSARNPGEDHRRRRTATQVRPHIPSNGPGDPETFVRYLHPEAPLRGLPDLRDQPRTPACAGRPTNSISGITGRLGKWDYGRILCRQMLWWYGTSASHLFQWVASQFSSNAPLI
jgi:hypothetical protein